MCESNLQKNVNIAHARFLSGPCNYTLDSHSPPPLNTILNDRYNGCKQLALCTLGITCIILFFHDKQCVFQAAARNSFYLFWVQFPAKKLCNLNLMVNSYLTCYIENCDLSFVHFATRHWVVVTGHVPVRTTLTAQSGLPVHIDWVAVTGRGSVWTI